MVTAVVGAGGKTTLIHALARQYRAQNRRVLVTTTTHMYREPGMLLDPDAARLCAELNERGYAVAGTPAPEGKFGPLPREVYLAGCAAVDEVLVEADGARGHLMKLPAAHEPVIPDNAQTIILVCNRTAIGHTIAEAAHRPQIVADFLGKSLDARLTAADFEAVAKRYLELLRAEHPACRVVYHPVPEER
ncbi:MAG: selenium cofactor biosynthesis protein YqeC [Oscillospiraceae bacterium]|nr:selenium cofactor biosynthesis protein YqeC [Oscillospiraceae bacterium]